MRTALAFLVLLGAGAARAEPTQILVDLRDDTGDADEQAIERILGVDLRLNSVHAADERFFIAEVDPDALPRMIDAIDDDPRVEHVEPNHVYEALMKPDDPRFSEQWSFQMIHADQAWDHAAGKGVVVAVIDTGVAYEERGRFKRVEDLAGTEFVEGYDFVNDSDHPNDDHGHGTHVSGTIAQTTNNGVGVTGLAHKAKIMPIKVLDRNGRGMAADISDAIRFAADEGAQVINMSLGGGLRSFVMQAAVAYARKKGVVVVCAAGNGSRGVVEFPAAYPGAFAVSAVGPDGALAPYSSWGKEIAIAAPGGDKSRLGEAGGILQNTIRPQDVSSPGQYLAFQGTSMAAPHVAATAALIMSAGVTKADEVEEILRSTAADKGAPGRDNRYGSGILDAGAAVAKAKRTSHGAYHLLGALAALALIARRRRGLGLGALVGAVLGSSGLFFLDGVLSLPIASLDLAVFGASGYRTAVWASALPFFALAIGLVGFRRLTGLLVGLGVGWAAHFLVAAIAMPADVQFIPGLAGILDRLWLFVNAGAIAALAFLMSRRPSNL